MEVFPSSLIIPPHEYRHVTLAFCPRAIQQYSATFEASVVGGQADPNSAGFVCELRGEGTLPSLSFQVGSSHAWSAHATMHALVCSADWSAEWSVDHSVLNAIVECPCWHGDQHATLRRSVVCSQEPTALDAGGRPLLKFGRLLAGCSGQQLLNVRNNGLLPASARIEMDYHPAFTLQEGSQVQPVAATTWS